MRVALLAILVASALPAYAENTLTDRDREIIAQHQRMRQVAVERARVRCVEQRGVDCATEEGLREWLMLELTREDAVLDRIAPRPLPSSGTGSTTPPR